MKIDFNELEKEMAKHGMPTKKIETRLTAQNAKELITEIFNFYVPNFEWIPEYDKVVEWLTDNEGRSLLLAGSIGRGKTVLSQNVIPAFMYAVHNKIFNYYKAKELNEETEKILGKFFTCIDEVGFEGVKVDYGERSIPFIDLLNRLEEKGGLSVVTTNLTGEQMLNIYGSRAMDRIKALFKIVRFEGASFRK